jgi:hypothetical protein
VASDPYFTERERRFVQEVFPHIFFGIQLANWHSAASKEQKEETIRRSQFGQFKLSLVPRTDMETIATDKELSVLEVGPVVPKSRGMRGS